MKGLERVILYVFLMIIGLILLFAVLSSLFNYNPQNTGVTINQPTTDLNDHFDYTSYLLSTSPTDLSTYNECDKLKNAIKYAIITGKPYEVDEISYGSDLVSPVKLPLIGDCPPEEDIEIPIGSGINQTVCRFKPISNNLNVGVTDYGGISDATSLDFDNCIYDYNQYYSLPQYTIISTHPLTILPKNVIGPEVEELNLNPGTINLYYSPDHFYIKNGDYSHYQSINSVTAFDNAYNGPGRLKIYVGNATSINGECKFNIYLCPRPAIAQSKSDSSINIFKIFKDLELSDLPSLPYYIRDFSKDNTYSPMTDYSKEVYYWNSYDIKLDKDYRVETIINAIKSGLYLNARLNNYFAHPHWDIINYPVDSSTECWDASFDDLIKSDSFDERTRSIRFNCGSDNFCSGDLIVKVALRRDSRTDIDIDRDGKDDKLSYVSGVISFCEYKTSTCPTYTSPSACNSAGCKWCPSYGGRSNGCGDTCSLWSFIGGIPTCLDLCWNGGSSGECFTTAQCVEPTVSSPPSCTWTDSYAGWCWGCCSSTNKCTIPAANCY